MNDKEKDGLRKSNLDSTMKVKKEPSRKLKELLKLQNVHQLASYYEVITDEERYSYDIEDDIDIDELVDNIYEELTDKETIELFFNSLSSKEYKILMNIIENGGSIKDDYFRYSDYTFIKSFGIVYMFNYKNEIHIIIPDEIIGVIKEIDTDKYKEIVDDNTLIIELAYAMCNLYGVVPMYLFENACFDYYGIDDINFDCLLYANRGNNIRCINVDDGLYLVKEEYLDDERYNIMKIIGNMNDILCHYDFKDIELEEMIKYSDLFYYKETDASKRMASYLSDNGLDDGAVEDIIASIIQMFKSDYIVSMSILNDTLYEYNFELNEDNYDEFMLHFNDVFNNIPLWGNKGWTNKEIVLENYCEDDISF